MAHSLQSKQAKVLTTLWLLSFILALALVAVLAPVNLQNITGDWQLTAAAPALPDFIPYSAFVNFTLIVRYLALAVCLSASGLIVLSQPANWSGWLAAYTFLFLPLALNLAGYTESWPYPEPWDALLGPAYGLAQLFGLAGLVVLAHVFPNGRFQPRWTGILMGFLLSLILGVFVSSNLLGGQIDSLWVVGALGLLVLFSLGLASQVYRYRLAPPAERRSSRGFVVALGLFLLGTIFSVVFSDGTRPISSLIFLYLDILLLSLVPISTVHAILRHGLWGGEAGLDKRPVRLYFAGWAAAVVVGITLLSLVGDRLASASTQPVGALAWDKPAIPVIVDTDLSMDDHLALLFLLRHPGVQIKAITVSGTGEAHCQPGVRNMLDILENLQAPEIPVTCGRETPLAGDHVFPDAWRQGADTLYGVSLPPGTRQPYAGNAVELMRSVLEQEPKKVTLITLGPLTNPGEALQAHPDLAGEIERIYIMGGAVDVPGNVGVSTGQIDNQVAEWNIYADPSSANLVLRAGAPVTLVPLDATNYVPVTMPFLGRLDANRETPAAQLAYDLMSARRDVILSGGASFWDVLTAAVVLDGSLSSYKIGGIVVEEAEGPTSGQTRLDASGPKAIYAIWADGSRFEEQFLQALNR